MPSQLIKEIINESFESASSQTKADLEQVNTPNPNTPTAQKYTPPEQLKDLLVWEAPSRIFVKRDKQWFTTMGIVLGAVMIIMALLGQFLLVIALGALGFMGYAMSSVAPSQIQHKITTQGITTAGISYAWTDFSEFFLEDIQGIQLVHIRTVQKLPGMLSLILNDKNATKEKIVELISPFVFYQQNPPKTWIKSVENFISSKLDLS